MKNVIIILIIIALVVGGYRFVTSRKKGEETPRIETTETEITIAPTLENSEEIESSDKVSGDLPPSGLSSEEKEMPSQEEMEKMIKEFESEE